MHTHQPVPRNVKVNRELGKIIEFRQTVYICTENEGYGSKSFIDAV